jgi:hypothetical protein
LNYGAGDPESIPGAVHVFYFCLGVWGRG